MRLVVFFSRGMSLDAWRRTGILDRELALYRGLRPHLESLAFVTYGRGGDLALDGDLRDVEVLANRWKLPANVYSVVAPYLHRRSLRQATLFKTNQINGAWCAIVAKRLFRKKLVVRCGYLWSDFVARLYPGSWRPAVARDLERRAFQSADAVIAAGEPDRAEIVSRYGVSAERVRVVPNYVDTTRFRPMPEVERQQGRIVFVGRLEEQKNLPALIEALQAMPRTSLSVVGEGPLRADLEALARRLGVDVSFLGTRPHAELPRLLNQSALFVLPSLYEGNPKALLEAMACGMAVVGTDVAGTRDILVHRETGYVCGASAPEIRNAVTEVLADASLRERMGAAASAYVRERCSLQSVVAQELDVLRSVS